MSKTYIRYDAAGRLIARYKVPDNEQAPEGDWHQLTTEDGRKLLRTRAIRRHFMSHGQVRRKVRIALRGPGRVKVGSPAVITIEGIPDWLPSVRLVVADQVVEVPAGETLTVTWNTPTAVTVKPDPTQPEIEGRSVQILFE
jgi:hypothetical protein